MKPDHIVLFPNIKIRKHNDSFTAKAKVMYFIFMINTITEDPRYDFQLNTRPPKEKSNLVNIAQALTDVRK